MLTVLGAFWVLSWLFFLIYPAFIGLAAAAKSQADEPTDIQPTDAERVRDQVGVG